MPTKEITRAVYESIASRLGELGFIKRTGGHFTKELAPEILGYFGSGQHTIRKEGVVAFWPVVGVRFQTLHRLVDELRELEFQKYGAATVGTQIGYLMPEKTFLEWHVQSPESAPDAAEGMLRALEQYGLPFMERYKSLREAIGLLFPANHGGDMTVAYRLIVAYTLLGEREKALDVLNHWEASEGKATYPAADIFRRFAKNFKARVNSIPSFED